MPLGAWAQYRVPETFDRCYAIFKGYQDMAPQSRLRKIDKEMNVLTCINLVMVLQGPGHAAPATASASAVCPGGRAARGARAALHAFLGSVSALAPSLPAASAAALQAVRCWALHYSQHDRAFLHRYDHRFMI